MIIVYVQKIKYKVLQTKEIVIVQGIVYTYFI